MHVVATAGHVDHGKSTLVRALTGMEPDRWAEEHRRGMTLDLGFVWTKLADESQLAFVDVPGHERFVSTMLAGVGPIPAVMVVVAADSGWQAQTAEHVAILDALDVRHGLLVVTRSDLADPAPALEFARDRLAGTSLGAVEAVVVSAVTGAGMGELRAALGRLVARLPLPDVDARVRLFTDRAFSIKGSGTVVTGTLGAGRLAVGDTVELFPGGRLARIRELQALHETRASVEPVARVAVNLRGISSDEVGRGSALLTPKSWMLTREFDVRLDSLDPRDLPGDLVLHLGTAAVPCRIRPLGQETGRIRTAFELPVQPADRCVLRDPSRRLVTGVHVLDVDPPQLRRRGAAQLRGEELSAASDRPDPAAEIARRGAVTRERLAVLGILGPGERLPAGVLEIESYLVDPHAWQRWQAQLDAAVDAHHASRPLENGISAQSARQALNVPALSLMDALVKASHGGLATAQGRIFRPGSGPVFSPGVQAALSAVAARLAANHFDSPEAPELQKLGMTSKILGAASGLGLFIRLPGDILLHPAAIEEAYGKLATLPQPFGLADVRAAIGTSRRIALPLLEHMDALRLTVRVDDSHRRIRQG